MPALIAANEANARRAPGAFSLAARHPAAHIIPSSAVYPDVLNARGLESRQVVTGIIPTYYRDDGPGPGATVGIVLGSIAGFLLLVWLLWALTGQARGNAIRGEEEIVVRRPRRNSNSHRSRRSTRTEVREFSRSPRRSGGRSAIIVEERRHPRTRSIVVEERSRVPGDDVVEVIEEHDDYHERRGTRRSSGYR